MGLRYRVVVDAPLGEVVAWHARPGAIRRLMPPWQPLGVQQEASSLDSGRAVLRLPGGLRWVAQHRALDREAGVSGEGFVDELVNLPLHWCHTHRFESAGEAATAVTDTVETPVPGSFLVQTFRYRSGTSWPATWQRTPGRPVCVPGR